MSALYYIRDTRVVSGNCVMWWAVDRGGYTSDLNKAWRVPAEQAAAICACRGTDLAYPCEVIDALAVRHFDVQNIRGQRLRPTFGKEST